jgi:hypothetical protein
MRGRDVFPGGTSRSWIQILPSQHRVFDAGAVLGVVNALCFASPRPVAGPSGIDDASARHVLGSYAMVVSMMTTRTRLTRESRRRMLSVITSVPHGTPSVRRNGQRSAHPVGAHRARHRAQSSPHRSPLHDDRRRLVGTMNCEPRDLSPRIILRITRCEGNAFTSGIARPWSD